MNVETTQAIDELGSRIDRLEAGMQTEFASVRDEMQTGFASVREEMRTEFASVRQEMRTEIASVRDEMRTELASVRAEIQRDLVHVQSELGGDIAGLREGLDTNWTRTLALFETLRDDIQLLAGHVAELASRRPRG